MAGTSYTRQSTIQNNDTIEASLFNNEYNKLVNAFQYVGTLGGTTGHRHDGTAAEGGNIYKVGDEDFLNKIQIDGQLNGSAGNNRIGFFVEVSSAAVEQIRIQDGVVTPVTDSDIDLGTSSIKYKHIYTDNITSDTVILSDTTSNSNSTYGPNIEIYRDGGAATSSGTSLSQQNKLGAVDFFGNNNAGTPEKIKYAKVFCSIKTKTDGSEDGRLSFSVMSAGTHTEGANPSSILDLEPDVAVFKQDVRIEASASGGVNTSPTPILELFQIDGPASDDGDHLGEVQFTGYNDNGFSPIKHKYAGIHAEIIDESNATEDGSLHFTTVTAGTEDTTVLTLNGTESTFNTPLTLKGVDAGVTGPNLDLYHLSGSPATNDNSGTINFYSDNASNEKVLFARIETKSTDITNGAERGQMKISLRTTDGSANLTGVSDILTFNAGSSSASPEVQIEESLIINSYEAGGAFAGGPKITLRRQELYTGVDNDEFSVIAFEAFNDRGLSSGGPENIEYAHIHAKILDASDGTEDGQLEFGAMTAGSLVEPVLTLSGLAVTATKPVAFPAQSSEPSSPSNGWVYYDTDDHKLKVYANGAWANLN